MTLSAALAALLVAAPLDLEWAAPEGCPSEPEVRAKVLELSGIEPSGASRLAVRARLRSEEGRWGIALEIASAAGRTDRTLEADSCAALAEATEVILALALAEAPPSRTPIVAGPAPRPRAPTAPIHFDLGLSGLVGAGHLPSPAFGGAVSVRLGLPPMRLELSAQLWAPREVEATARLWGASGALRGAWVLPLGDLELAPELGVELGQIRAEGLASAVDGARTRAGVHAQLTGGVFGGWWLHPALQLRLGGRLGVALARPSVAAGDAVLFRVQPWMAQGELGLAVRLW